MTRRIQIELEVMPVLVWAVLAVLVVVVLLGQPDRASRSQVEPA